MTTESRMTDKTGGPAYPVTVRLNKNMSDHENVFWSESQIKGLESRAKDYKSRLAAVSSELEAERQKVRVLREAAELAMEIAESWIHDQLDGTGQLEDGLSCLDPVRQAIATTEEKL